MLACGSTASADGPAVSAAAAPQNLCRIPTRTVLWRSLVDGGKTFMAATAAAPVESVPVFLIDSDLIDVRAQG